MKVTSEAKGYCIGSEDIYNSCKQYNVILIKMNAPINSKYEPAVPDIIVPSNRCSPEDSL